MGWPRGSASTVASSYAHQNTHGRPHYDLGRCWLNCHAPGGRRGALVAEADFQRCYGGTTCLNSCFMQLTANRTGPLTGSGRVEDGTVGTSPAESYGLGDSLKHCV